jgi:hypothetical protein
MKVRTELGTPAPMLELVLPEKADAISAFAPTLQHREIGWLESHRALRPQNLTG